MSWLCFLRCPKQEEEQQHQRYLIANLLRPRRLPHQIDWIDPHILVVHPLEHQDSYFRNGAVRGANNLIFYQINPIEPCAGFLRQWTGSVKTNDGWNDNENYSAGKKDN